MKKISILVTLLIFVMSGCTATKEVSQEVVTPDTQCRVCDGIIEDDPFLQNSSNTNEFLIK